LIVEYHRPKTIERALDLLKQTEPKIVPMGGGSYLNLPSKTPFGVVDLQDLGLNIISRQGKYLNVGATSPLQDLLDWTDTPPGLALSIRLEASRNLRQVGTVAGTLVAADGCSSFATTLLALNTELELIPPEQQITLGNFLPLREELLNKRIITKLTVPLMTEFSFQYVARTPADLPIVCVAVARWPSGRTRIALGGYGSSPTLAMDGTESTGAETAVRNAFAEAGDHWASAEYRRNVAMILTRRCLQELKEMG
jgi:CO/xanthine dehydrogenase FAD-binding subunit